MTEITVSRQNRFLSGYMLPLGQQTQLKTCLYDALKGYATQEALKESVEDAMNSKLCDLEELLTIHYVSENRNLSNISPIPSKDYFIFYTREDFTPLLKALKEGDFDLACALTPPKYRLIGYQELKETKEITEQGQGWGGQYSVMVIPPGIYPVFTRSFAYDKEKDCYTNHLKDSDGITTWLEGQCIDSSDASPGNLPYDKVYLGNPYVHSVARDIWEGKGIITLISPFEAVKVSSFSDGKERESYQIMDISLPVLLSVNPVLLRREEDRLDNAWEKSPLGEQISVAEHRKGGDGSIRSDPQPDRDR